MRFAASAFLVAMLLFVGGATTLLGTWAVTAACPVFLIAAVAGAVAMEDRDLAGAEGLLAVQTVPAGDVVGDVQLLDAAA